jgi:hypothetical protein
MKSVCFDCLPSPSSGQIKERPAGGSIQLVNWLSLTLCLKCVADDVYVDAHQRCKSNMSEKRCYYIISSLIYVIYVISPFLVGVTHTV